MDENGEERSPNRPHPSPQLLNSSAVNAISIAIAACNNFVPKVWSAKGKRLVRRDPLRISWGLRLNGHDAKADVVVASFRLEPLTEG